LSCATFCAFLEEEEEEEEEEAVFLFTYHIQTPVRNGCSFAGFRGVRHAQNIIRLRQSLQKHKMSSDDGCIEG
jgi:hypothetical protein